MAAISTVRESNPAAPQGTGGGRQCRRDHPLDAGGASPIITLSGNLTASGGNRSGSGVAGTGGAVWLKDALALNAATVTVGAGGGSAGVGIGGTVQFDGTVDSLGGTRALVVNTNAAATFSGTVGAGAALSTLTTNAGGGTALNGGSVRTTTGMTFGDALGLGANTTIDGGTGAVTFSSTVNGGFGLAVTSTGNVTFTGAVGGGTPLDSLGASGRTVTIGPAAVGNATGAGINLLASQNIVATGTVLSNGAPITLVANPGGTTAGTFRGIRLTNATFDSGSGDITMTGTGGTTGANDYGVQLVDSSLRATGARPHHAHRHRRRDVGTRRLRDREHGGAHRHDGRRRHHVHRHRRGHRRQHAVRRRQLVRASTSRRCGRAAPDASASSASARATTTGSRSARPRHRSTTTEPH